MNKDMRKLISVLGKVSNLLREDKTEWHKDGYVRI